jgi:TIR domain
MALEVFLSYSHQDKAYRSELEKHLSALKRQGIISSWSDGNIVPGTEWRPQIMTHLNTAQIILLLISADFMASDFCYSIEMTRAIERHKANQARVLPIILRPCDWKGTPFADLQALPTAGKAVTRWPTHDDAFEDVIQGIRTAIDDLSQTGGSAHP